MKYTFEYRLVVKEDRDDIIQFLNTYFYKDEPCTRAMKLSLEDILPVYEGIVDRCLQFPFSTIVTCVEDGKMAGVLLNSVWRRSDKVSDGADFDTGNKGGAIDSFGALLNECHRDFWKLAPSNVSAVLHREISSVATPYQRNGIATRLVTENITKAKLAEYDIGGVISETSSYSNQVLLKKQGFECLKELSYDKVVDGDGNKILQTDDGSKGLRLNFKPIELFNITI